MLAAPLLLTCMFIAVAVLRERSSELKVKQAAAAHQPEHCGLFMDTTYRTLPYHAFLQFSLS